MTEDLGKYAVKDKQTTAGFTTNAQTDYVMPEDTLEREITIVLNAKYSKYGSMVLAMDKLLDKMRKESDLVRMTSGI